MIAFLSKMHFYGNPSAKLKIIGVTGTNGKTTITTLLYQIATNLGYKAGLIGTIENIIVTEKRTTIYTTPDPITLNNLLTEMVKEKCEYVFIEVSSHAMDQNRLAGIKFLGGIFTNLTHDHLDYHKNFENYFQAKKKFFQILPANAFALSNVDDSYGHAMLKNIKAKKFLCGFTQQVDFKAKIIKLDFSGIELDINGTLIKSKLLGKFNAYNLLAVWSVCQLLGFDDKKVKKILENIKPPRGRFEFFESQNKVLVIIDYAHTPDALEKIILAIRDIKKSTGRLILIFGCGGDRDHFKRSIMGKIGAQLSDLAIFTSDNPRSEDPEKIIEQMKKELSEEDLKKIKTITDRRVAMQEAYQNAQAGDIVLCAGKGHENYQEINGIKYHFDDLEELKKIFNA